jgi:hypothetical protein
MAEPELIPNIDYLGRCYDVVQMDPLDLGATVLKESVIDLDVTGGETATTPDGSFTIPKGVHHSAAYSLDGRVESSVISSSEEFQRSFKESVDVDAGVEGVFEFSGSRSVKDTAEQARSRKNSFVYSSYYQENHKLWLDLDNPKAPLKVTTEFAEAVDDLPPQDDPAWVDAYQTLIKRFGTHYTTEIVLGGLAYQRTTGSSKTFLQSSESEEGLKAHASVQIEALRSGAGVEQAKSEASKVDAQYELERTTIEYRGGDGAPTGIDSNWIQSLHQRPAIVKAKLDRISSLLCRRFFPDDEYIADKQALLDMTISSWIAGRGTPGCGTAPLRFGEPVVLAQPWADGSNLLQPPVLDNKVFAYPTGADGKPSYEPPGSVAIQLESVDGSRAGAAILAGDRIRIKHLATGAYLRKDSKSRDSTMVWVDGDVSQATEFTLIQRGDSPAMPKRAGEFFLETDRVTILWGEPQSPEQQLVVYPSGLYLGLGGLKNRDGEDNPQFGFQLRRCAAPGADDDGFPESPVTG